MAKDLRIKEKSSNAYRTIGEASLILDVPQHILRFWESKFEQISPQKNKGRRYYSPSDLALLSKIKQLLYVQGLTIRGVQSYLESNTNDNFINASQIELISIASNKIADNKTRNLNDVLEILIRVREKLLSI